MNTLPPSIALLALVTTLNAASTIAPANRSAYGANLGWIDWLGDTNNGAVIGEYVCSGYLYSANVGWINLGSGSPTNSISYQNLSANDFGVNMDGLGNLRGYAYGANIGWISFETTGMPKVDLQTGGLSGSVWSANCGWISLSNSVASVQTDSIRSGQLARNGLPIAWLVANFGTTSGSGNADPDGDGQSNAQEYLAGTNPNDASDVLRIKTFQRDRAHYNMLTWNSKPTRFYAVQYRSTLDENSIWMDLGYYPSPGVGATGFFDSNSQEFYRIRAYRPLMP